MSMYELYKAFGLDDMTIEFVGHSIALHDTEQYLKQPAQVLLFFRVLANVLTMRSLDRAPGVSFLG
jgi:RAB protein geranylgeranyltransferase component A